MAEDFKFSLDSLIKDELAGKALAIARYDEMIWKIRSGYAVLLYGAVGIVATLVSQKAIVLTSQTALAVIVLVGGFSVFGASLDYCFMSAKLRVVNYRDRLVELAQQRVSGHPGSADSDADLLECLKNSGERKERINWNQRPGLSVCLLYYGGTGSICTIATWLLVP